MDEMNSSILALCFVVKKIVPDNIQNFMRAWLKQSCKDFKIVFIDRELDDKQQVALDYALKFAENVKCLDNVIVVQSEEFIPQSRQMVVLNSTSILPVDNNEVMSFKTGKDLVKRPFVSKPNEQLQMQKPAQLKSKTASQPSNKQNTEKQHVAQKQQKTTQSKQNAKSLKIVCYTCITGNYDKLCPIKYPNDSIDFICFTDDLTINSSGWKLRPIPEELHALSKVKQQRILKICPQTYLSEYDASLWIDANFMINCDLEKSFFSKYDLKRFSLYTNKHPLRDCIYDEEKECIKRSKDISKNTMPQIARYRKEGMPCHNGLAETNLMLRDHHDIECKNVMDLWKNEVLNGSHRDQLSFNYACWKSKFKYGHLAEGDYRKFDNTHNFILLMHQPNLKNNSLMHNNPKTIGIVIINYNTSELVNALIKSIRKHVQSIAYNIIVFDNSTIEKFHCPDNVVLLNNTQKQLIDFDTIIRQTSVVKSMNNYASYKHALTIQFIIDYLQYDSLVFMDSDVLLKKDIDFIDSTYAVVADFPGTSAKPRFLPFIMYVNRKRICSNKIRYLDVNRMHGASNAYNSCLYDTGCSFYEDVINAHLPVKHIKNNEYIVHFKGGSWNRTQNDQSRFLEAYAQFWR